MGMKVNRKAFMNGWEGSQGRDQVVRGTEDDGFIHLEYVYPLIMNVNNINV